MGKQMKMKITRLDSLDEEEARKLTGCKVIDESDQSVGTVNGLWMDSSTNHVEFLGVKSNWLPGKVHVVPAGDAQIIEEGNLIRLRYPAAQVKKAPTFSPEAELAQIEKEQINAYCGRAIAAQRVSSIDETRPTETTGGPDSEEKLATQGKSEQSVDGRENVERSEKAFFNQSGFVTDSMPEVDASTELRRVQEEVKARSREDRHKSGSLD
jgi:PRC-barrel domain